MRELVGSKNTIGRTAAVLKSPIKRPLPLPFCDVLRPTVLYLGRNLDEMEIIELTFNTEFHENSSLSSNLNILC